MTFEANTQAPEAIKPFPHSEVIFDAHDPRLNDLSREDRIRHYYARELASGNLGALSPRFRSIDDDKLANEPFTDIVVVDPLKSDPQIADLASMLNLSGYKPDLDPFD